MAAQAVCFASTAAVCVTWFYFRNQKRTANPQTAVAVSPILSPGRTTVVYSVDHLSTSFPQPDTFPSPLLSRQWPKNLNFVGVHEQLLETQQLAAAAGEVRALVRAGPVERLYWSPSASRAAVVTCGGLCPGLNTVIRELVMSLHYVYGATEIWGVPNGYGGIYGPAPWRPLSPDLVSNIHTLGGTILGSSRGGFDLDRILGALQDKGITQLFVIGGDGTHRGVLALCEGAAKRGQRISIIAIPKSIDMDIPVIDKTFGFDSAIEEALRPIACANVEAKSALNGVGLVKLMGREAGFIALQAAMASRDVNLVLIPEAPWRLAKVLSWLDARMAARGHAVIVVAEGAESEEQKEEKAAAAAKGALAASAKDASGNKVLDDVGLYLKNALTQHLKKINGSIKYIDPSYIIRSSPPCASDSLMCTHLAYNACHAAMAGYTGVTVGLVETHYVLLPVSRISTMPHRVVDINGREYARLCASTGQPSLT